VTKALIFDLGGVIVPLDFPRAYAAIAQICPYSPTEIPQRIRSSGLVNLYETGQLDTPSFISQLSAVLDLHITEDQFRDLWSALFLPDPLLPESLFSNLAARYPLILLSNTNELHFENIRARFPLLRHFHHLILSYEIGAAKPSACIFEAATAKAHCRPEECFFTDDIPAFVAAARQSGLDAVQFHNYSQLQTELQSRGIL
jgi:FMN phosphatase YigB (HAD superfamily)